MELDHEVKDLEQAEARAEVALVALEAEDLVQDRVGIASAPVVVKERPINWGLPAMSRNAQNAALQ